MAFRAQKRLLTMRSVQRVALDLFERRGFDPVSVEEISEASGVSPSTIYRHFKTKERLVLWDETDAAIEEALTRHLGKTSPMEALRRSFTEAFDGLTADELTHQRRRGAMIDDTPQLYAASAGDLVAARLEIQAVLGKVYGAKCRGLRAEMTARIALASLVAGFETWQRSGPRKSLPGCIDQAFEAALGAFE